MSITLISILSLGFVLGIKHAIEPDHVIAVSTIASKSKKLWQSTLAGVFWGIGHTLTLFIVGIILIIMKDEISAKISMSLEFLVGIMLVYLGIMNIISFREKKQHAHSHVSSLENKYPYLKSTAIGLVHGLAGSAAMVLLTMTTVQTAWEAAIYIMVFGAGTILGMLCFTTVLGIPFVFSSRKYSVNRILVVTAGGISFAFGIYYMYNLGVTEGLFSLWI
ncbi:sulfite exporter TauE/SafE family protein [Psychrobacillus sp. OK032]|uniref:HoxN/HupN/NixA family nickel/cobalt transporter n=1 Tax=Psychrobacillus sp. OK032 TaxID=1884358 RepID=UPI0008D88BD7|nr:sulfite exporter TauE/SafE family protein [Psychrobacillus sp. OK032]SES37750.1 Cytochrome C biogenesis protein transmembrane region [Psychrobacillus sp. OK032]